MQSFFYLTLWIKLVNLNVIWILSGACIPSNTYFAEMCGIGKRDYWETLLLAAVSFKLTVTVTEMGNNWNILNQLTVTVTATEIKLVTEM